MKKQQLLKLRCYLEGISVPIQAATVTTKEKTPVIARLSFPPVPSLKRVKRRTMVHLFFYDSDDECWRRWFHGEVVGKSSRRSDKSKAIDIIAMSGINYLNEIPSKYLASISSKDVVAGSYEYQFYGIPIIFGANYKLQQQSDFDFSLNDMDKGIYNYMMAILSSALGDDMWEAYYKNAGKRFMIEDNHVVIDSGEFYQRFKSERMVRALKDAHKQISSAKYKILDGIISFINKYSHSYLNVTTPAYQSDGESSEDDVEITVHKKKGSLSEYVVLPSLRNIAPPRCNVVFADKLAQLNVNIYENTLTRLMNQYYLLDSTDDDLPAIVGVYPSEITSAEKNQSPVGQDVGGFEMTAEELDRGVHGLVQDKSYMYYVLLGRQSNTKDEILKTAENNFEMFNEFTQNDYWELKHKRNTVKVDKREFNPYIVCGLPGLVYDIESDRFFYGRIAEHSQTVDMKNGQVSSHVLLKDSFEVSDVRDIMGVIKDNKYYYEKADIFVNQDMVAPFTQDAEGDSITKLKDEESMLTKAIYKGLLKGSGGDQDYTGWKSILDEPDAKVKNILSEIRATAGVGEREYCRREIATESEMVNILSNATIDKFDRDNTISTLSDKTIDAIKLSEEKIKINEGIFITERQNIVKMIKSELKGVIL